MSTGVFDACKNSAIPKLCVGAGAPSPPSEGFGFRAPPVTDTARKASRCRPQVQGVCRSTSGGRRGGNGGTAYKGLKRRDGRRDTPSVCESSRYRRALNNNDTCIILCTPTPWCKQQPHVLSSSVGLLKSLMQSASSLLRGSRGGYRRTPQTYHFSPPKVRS